MLVLAAALSAASIAAWARSRHAGPSGRCVSVVVASTMGGATIKRCGPAARAFCRENVGDAHITEACRKEGF